MRGSGPDKGAAHASDLPDGLFTPLAPEVPLADRIRPSRLDELVGQSKALGADGPLSRMAQTGTVHSIILWGPPGCGKTTIGRLLAGVGKMEPIELSAVFSGLADLREAFMRARSLRIKGTGTLVFIDEIHRFHKGQQDALLGAVENGLITLVGATTENPSFALIPALLSRCRVVTLQALDRESLASLIERAETKIGRSFGLTAEASDALCQLASGDGRYLLNLLEDLLSCPPPIDCARVHVIAQRRAPLYDRAGEAHYNLISALHKSVRGGDVDAALYWLARMLEGGEDPRYLARRLVRMASEDIGLADPGALAHALAGWAAIERLGQPEGELALAQITAELAAAPKSVSLYRAFKAARAHAHVTANAEPPMHARNAPTRWMREQGYGSGYVYDPDTEDGCSGLSYFPDNVKRRFYYRPTTNGQETHIYAHKLRWSHARRIKIRKQKITKDNKR